MAKIFAVITVARQVLGEYVFVKAERAFSQASQADALAAQLNTTFVKPDGSPKPLRLSTPQGEAECVCTAGGFELELD